RLDEPEQLVALPEEPHHEVVLGLDLDLSLGHGALIQRTRARSAEKRGGHPGGQPNRFPPSTCMCRWGTEFRASSPTFKTSRYPLSAMPSWRATCCAVAIISARTAASSAVTVAADSMCRRGTMSTWTGAPGLMS